MPRFELVDFLTPQQRISSFIATAQEDRSDIVEAADAGKSITIDAGTYIWLVRALKKEFPRNDKT